MQGGGDEGIVTPGKALHCDLKIKIKQNKPISGSQHSLAHKTQLLNKSQSQIQLLSAIQEGFQENSPVSACPRPGQQSRSRLAQKQGRTPQSCLIWVTPVCSGHPPAAPGWEHPGQREAAHRLQDWQQGVILAVPHPGCCPVLSCPLS